MTLTRKKLGPLFQECRDLIAKWDNGSEPVVSWHQVPVKAISDAVVKAWFALIEAAGTMDVEPSLKPAVLALDEFEDQFRNWAEYCEIAPDDTHPGGTPALWNAWSSFAEAMDQPIYRKPESIESLTAQGVGDRQIALIYGWSDEAGPQANKVVEERAKPGTHYDPNKWVHPAERRRISEADSQWSKRELRVDERIIEKHTVREAPESIEELINQRVPSKQIAMMKNVDVDEVRRVAAAIGIPLDGEIIRPIELSPADRLAEMRDQEDRTHAALQQSANNQRQPQQQPQTIEEAVLTLYLEGTAPGGIAEAMQDIAPGITTQKVSAIIQKAEAKKNDPVVS